MIRARIFISTVTVLATSLCMAGPVKKADLLPNQDEVLIPGTKVPLEEMNTAPTEPELQEEELGSRTILKARKEKERELKRNTKIKATPEKDEE